MASSLLLVTMSACEKHGHTAEAVPLRLVVVSSPLTYQRFQELQTGYEFELLQKFALDVGYQLQVKSVPNQAALEKALAQGKADLGAARLTESTLSLTSSYDQEAQVQTCRRQELSKRKLRIGKNLPLANMKRIRKNHLDCVIAPELESYYYLRFFPELKITKQVGETLSYHFATLNPKSEVAQRLETWLAKAKASGALETYSSSYKERIRALSFLDIRKFLRDQLGRFPKYSKQMHRDSKRFSIPWQVAAAMAYQESHWDNSAESFTGVKGLMQLTEETADHLGVDDRTDPAQSIYGGIKYLRMLLDRQPQGIPFSDRLAIALATYNVGPAHMIDAQKLAQNLGKNPYSWKDLQSVLPLLADPSYASHLKYGPARGREPVLYVEKVLAYLDLISVKI